MPMQQKLGLASNAPIRRQHIPGHGINCPACHDIIESDERGGDIHPSLLFEEAAKKYVELREVAGDINRARYVSPRTLRDDGQYIDALNCFFSGLTLDAIHPRHLRDYQQERSNGVGFFDKSAGSRFGAVNSHKINQELALLNRILRKAGLWTPEFEAKYHPLQAHAGDIPRALSPEEQAQFLEVSASREAWQVLYWYATIAFQTACSGCEMRGLHLGDINLFERVLQVREAHAKNTYRVRTVPLTENSLWAIERLLDRARALGSVNPPDFLFPFHIGRDIYDQHRPMTESGIKRQFEEVREAANVPWFTPHGFRHTGITRMAEAGVPIATIMSIVGHQSPRMTQHYTQISEQAKRKAVMDTAGNKQRVISNAPQWKKPRRSDKVEPERFVAVAALGSSS